MEDFMDTKSYKIKAFIHTTSLVTISDNTRDIHTDDSLRHAHNTDEVVSPQVEVCISEKLMTSYDNPLIPYQG